MWPSFRCCQGESSSLHGTLVRAGINDSSLLIAQTRAQNNRASAISIFRTTLRHEGVRGLWRGALASSLGQTPTNFVVFGVYGTALRGFEHIDVASAIGVSQAYSRFLHIYLAGSLSGVAQSFATAPFEHIKVQQQIMLRPGEPHLGLVATARAIIRGGGPLHLMRGTLATAMRDGGSFGVYFGSYDQFKILLSRASGLPEGRPPSELTMFVSGGLAGLLSWFLIFPLDVIKSVVQGSPVTAPRSSTAVSAVVMRLYREGGLRSFFRCVLILRIGCPSRL